MLPGALRQPIATAYLLARATDTVADTAQVSRLQRQSLLARLATAVASQPRPAGLLEPLVAELLPRQHQPDERTLIQTLPGLFDAFDRLDTADQADIRRLLGTITSGQALDLERFDPDAGPRALASCDELLDYTWRVAGCVGEFWTDLCARHLDDYANLPASEMRAIGREFGMGLQMVNILCDVGADLAAGRCYFPAADLTAAGLAASTLRTQPERFMPLYSHWIDEAAARLDAGVRYALAVRHRRVRAACALPALIGLRTLSLLRAAGPTVLDQRVKVPRAEVRRLLWQLALHLAGRDCVQRMARELAA